MIVLNFIGLFVFSFVEGSLDICWFMSVSFEFGLITCFDTLNYTYKAFKNNVILKTKNAKLSNYEMY